ncbi:alpha/beta fold hydrolase [Haloechinothrix halophila]|uniref:alpha/beta fold hydrolase n=1 Tax=Haloechinothrix halophila TaxID=1069073 RepID=UPI000407020B|nr:alpha/beta fold hydrolase [Haloechinothrix halophila]
MTKDAERLVWCKDDVAGGITQYGVGGTGRPVLFLHGWGLSGRSYEPALRRLLAAGRRVYAPSLPGFGGTAPLEREDLSLGSYAAWVADYVRDVGIETPIDVLGHSFGGGVGVRLAHDAPDLVERLILVNAIGGSAWRDGRGVVRPMAERPLWDWGFQLRNEVRPSRRSALAMPRIVREAVPNLARNPGVVWRVASMARAADLATELAALRRRRLPVTVTWSDRDTVIPFASFAALRAALGDPHSVIVSGGHGWLIDDATLFGQVLPDLFAERDDASARRPAA